MEGYGGNRAFTGGPVDVLGVVEYQEGAVVSREIVRRPCGTVSVFAFDEGEGLSEHTAPFDALAVILEGTCEISIDSVAHRVEAGRMILMPAGRPHAVKAVTRFTMLLVMVR